MRVTTADWEALLCVVLTQGPSLRRSATISLTAEQRGKPSASSGGFCPHFTATTTPAATPNLKGPGDAILPSTWRKQKRSASSRRGPHRAPYRACLPSRKLCPGKPGRGPLPSESVWGSVQHDPERLKRVHRGSPTGRDSRTPASGLILEAHGNPAPCSVARRCCESGGRTRRLQGACGAPAVCVHRPWPEPRVLRKSSVTVTGPQHPQNVFSKFSQIDRISKSSLSSLGRFSFSG